MTSPASLKKQPDNIAFIDLAAQQQRIKPAIEEAMANVLAQGAYIMGAEVTSLEEQLAEFCGAKHCISCSSGTDALALVLMAKGLKPGDAVFAPSFTFAATAEVVAWLGATVVFVDSDPVTFNMAAQDLKKAISWAEEHNLTPRGVISVDLFGQPADYDDIEAITEEYGLWLLDDAAQGLGAVYKGRSIGTIGMATATSFFPAKPLGCYGDGGAIFTDDDDLAATIKSLRVHGKGKDKYDNIRIGMNGRLDTLQAAILIEKLAIFPDELEDRRNAAQYYNAALKDVVQVPVINNESLSAWAQYTIVLDEKVDREALQKSLKDKGVPTAIYYPRPLHLQTAYQSCGRTEEGALPVCENLSDKVLSLPMHPYLKQDVQDYIIESVKTSLLAQQS